MKLQTVIYTSLLTAAFLFVAPNAVPQTVSSKSSAVAEGKRLFTQLNCNSCHSIGTTGGCLAPPLDGVGSRRSAQYLSLRLSNAKGDEDRFIKLIGHEELLPHPRFAKKQVDALIAYLQNIPPTKAPYVVASHPKPPGPDKPTSNWKPLPASASSKAGAELFSQHGCAMCHSVGKQGGWLAPRLDGVGSRHSRQYIEAIITNPSGANDRRGAALQRPSMPKITLTKQEISNITDFLLTLPKQP